MTDYRDLHDRDFSEQRLRERRELEAQDAEFARAKRQRQREEQRAQYSEIDQLRSELQQEIANLRNELSAQHECQIAATGEVKTKFSKSFTTWFFPVGDDIHQIVVDWVNYLRREKLWGRDDPLFPATKIVVGDRRHFEASGPDRKHWSSAGPIRAIFKGAFAAAGLPSYYRRTNRAPADVGYLASVFGVRGGSGMRRELRWPVK
jgi:hypothetical protein